MASHQSHQDSTLFVKKTSDQEPLPSKVAQSTVTHIYQANIGRSWRNVSMLWCKTLMSHTLHLTIDSTIGSKLHYTCKIDVKPWNFWSRKGYKSLDVDGHEIEVYWDFRSAKFYGGSPEPTSDYYVAAVFEDEVPLFVGDNKKKAYKRTKSKPAQIEAMQVVKKENVFAKKTFITRARFDEKMAAATRDSEIIVESITSSGASEPEMSIFIEGVKLIHVKNLQWKFRGNETVMMNKEKSIQVFWDVHDWLFSGSDQSGGSGPGVFIFKPGHAEAEESETSDREGCDNEDGNSSVYYSTRNTSEFCLVLCAYKLD
ncbi:uncharacterized protein LOC129317743 [Prosopis cineraria]|uniref:uncharacterized protein LOC129317743 n=1 Tax=Prosopis cineraria TaxID=364024 RepID=UPI002410A2DE|nr:uncharacterized protein LOC129317743 [Prosopis cineraria]